MNQDKDKTAEYANGCKSGASVPVWESDVGRCRHMVVGKGQIDKRYMCVGAGRY